VSQRKCDRWFVINRQDSERCSHSPATNAAMLMPETPYSYAIT
jgi:hypothetical protein